MGSLLRPGVSVIAWCGFATKLVHKLPSSSAPFVMHWACVLTWEAPPVHCSSIRSVSVLTGNVAANNLQAPKRQIGSSGLPAGVVASTTLVQADHLYVLPSLAPAQLPPANTHKPAGPQPLTVFFARVLAPKVCPDVPSRIPRLCCTLAHLQPSFETAAVIPLSAPKWCIGGAGTPADNFCASLMHAFLHAAGAILAPFLISFAGVLGLALWQLLMSPMPGRSTPLGRTLRMPWATCCTRVLTPFGVASPNQQVWLWAREKPSRGRKQLRNFGCVRRFALALCWLVGFSCLPVQVWAAPTGLPEAVAEVQRLSRLLMPEDTGGLTPSGATGSSSVPPTSATEAQRFQDVNAAWRNRPGTVGLPPTSRS